MNFIELVVNGATPDFVPPVVCIQIHLLSSGLPDSRESTPRGTGDMIPLKYEVVVVVVGGGGGVVCWALFNNRPSKFWRSPEAFPPLLLVTKATLLQKIHLC